MMNFRWNMEESKVCASLVGYLRIWEYERWWGGGLNQ
jgi:hypothetical protein